MNLYTLDFESYFDQEYSLKKLTNEEYIRDKRFKVLCCGIQRGHEKPIITREPLKELTQGAVLCHNASFDGFILNEHYGLRPAFWFDTLSMSRLLHPHLKSHSLAYLVAKYGLTNKTLDYTAFSGKQWHELTPDEQTMVTEGCKRDVELTFALFKKLIPMFPRGELKVIDINCRMATEPCLRLDKPLLEAYLKETIEAQDNLLNKLGVEKTTLNSNEKFATLLKSFGVEPPQKKSLATDKQIWAFAKTDEGFKELCESGNEDVRNLCEARLSAKSTIGATRAGRFLAIASRGALPIPLLYYGAHTGRFSGRDGINMQNLPRGGALRKAIMAPEGHKLCVIDLAGIELRVLAWVAGNDYALSAFREGRDLYCELATDFYGRKITKADKAERHLGKSITLGAGFGIGWRKMQATLKQQGIELGEAEARKAITAYRTLNFKVPILWGILDNRLQSMYRDDKFACPGKGYTIKDRKTYLPNSGFLDYRSLAIDNKGGFIITTAKGVRNLWGGTYTENLVQALARIIMTDAMKKIAERYKILWTTHDECVYLSKCDESDDALAYGMQIMKTPPDWCSDLPLDAEGFADDRYSK